jgi:FkbM family methyltransferase
VSDKGIHVGEIGMLVHCGHVLVLPCKRGAFATNRHDQIMTYALAAYGEYGEDEFSVLEHVLKPGMTAVDVGANIGTHTVAFASMVGDKGRVMSFEPVICNFHLLCANIAFSGRQNIYPNRAIVGSENRIRFMLQVDQEQKLNYGRINAKKSAEESDKRGVGLPEITLDSLGLTECDLIKIDVEGNELDVLMGAIDTIEKHKPTLFAECNDGDDPSRLLEFMHARGYHTYWVYNRLYRPNNYKGSRDAKDGRDRNIIAVQDPTILTKGPTLEPCIQ